MALNAKNAGNGKKDRIEQPLIEPGVYPARLVQLIDLGLQAQRPYKGQDKPPVQEIMLTYELVDCFMVDEAGEEVADKPRWISETLPFYGLFADKAKSTQRYHAFDPKEAFDGDFAQAVGLPINVTLVNNMVGEKTYTNIANVAAMRPRDAAACPELANAPKTLDLDAPDMEVYGLLPKWIQEKIQANLNFQGSAIEAAIKGKPAAPAAKAEKPKREDPPAPKAEDDDLPY
jgi:hypothetical protein